MRKAINTGILWFVFGVCATEAIVDTFCPQYGDVLWLRVAGGLAPAVICTLGYASALRRAPSTMSAAMS
jgi:hypothetical protein